MAAKCKTCTEEVLNADFVKCYGLCSSTFHSKCVSLSKTLVNALGANPNIRWYCHNCNLNNPIVSSVDEMKSSINQLSASLTSDLGKFISAVSEMTALVAKSMSTNSPAGATMVRNDEPAFTAHGEKPKSGTSLKRRRGQPFLTNPSKVHCGNDRLTRSSAPLLGHPSRNAVGPRPDDESRKSIVVSNVAPDVCAAMLTKFICSKAKVSEDQIKVTSLVPRSINMDEAKFLQYRVSFPTTLYGIVSVRSFWPVGVRTRDFVNKSNVRSRLPERVPVPSNLFVSEADDGRVDAPINEQINETPVQAISDDASNFLLNRMTTVEDTSFMDQAELSI